jgi:hypothetical protein
VDILTILNQRARGNSGPRAAANLARVMAYEVEMFSSAATCNWYLHPDADKIFLRAVSKFVNRQHNNDKLDALLSVLSLLLVSTCRTSRSFANGRILLHVNIG